MKPVASFDPDEFATRVTGVLRRTFPDAALSDLAPLPGGASSITFAASATGMPHRDRVVIKAAPPGLEPVRNRDMLRQARIITMLGEQPGVVVPQVLATDEGAPPDVPPLFVTDFIVGDSFEPLTSFEADGPPPDVIEARALAAARMLPALQRVDLEHPALNGERVFTLEQEINRWSKAWSTVDDDLYLDTAKACEERLLRAIPASLPATVVHGDYRLGNMLCEGNDVKAVIDWEIWSINDPRLDVGWMTMIADPKRPQSRRIDPGMPSPERLLEEYESARGATVADFGWFCGLVRYKLAATSSLITKNNRRRENPDPDGESHASYAAAVLDQALDYLS